MFDPHRTRSYDKRYYTRKGQVIQAKRVDSLKGVQRNLIPMYKEYMIKNNLISVTPPPPPEPYVFNITNVRLGTSGDGVDFSNFITAAQDTVISGPALITTVDTAPNITMYTVANIWISSSQTYTVNANSKYYNWNRATPISGFIYFRNSEGLYGLAIPINEEVYDNGDINSFNVYKRVITFDGYP